MDIHQLYDMKFIQLAPAKYKFIYAGFFVVLMLLFGLLVRQFIEGDIIPMMIAAGLAYGVGIPIFKYFVKIPQEKEVNEKHP